MTTRIDTGNFCGWAGNGGISRNGNGLDSVRNRVILAPRNLLYFVQHVLSLESIYLRAGKMILLTGITGEVSLLMGTLLRCTNCNPEVLMMYGSKMVKAS
jgi:hypothetical protein